MWRPLSGRIEITLKTGEQPIMDKEKRSDVDSKTGRKTSIGWVKPMVSCHIWGFAKLGFWMIWGTPIFGNLYIIKYASNQTINLRHPEPMVCIELQWSEMRENHCNTELKGKRPITVSYRVGAIV